MVVIIDGEVVADTDPRAKARRQRGGGTGGASSSGFSGDSSAGRRPGGGFGTLHGGHNSTSTPSSSTFGRDGGYNTSDLNRGTSQSTLWGEDNIVTRDVASWLGIQGKTVRIPAIRVLRKPEFLVPLIYVVLLVILICFTGVQGIILIAALYILGTPSLPPQEATGARRQ